MEFRHNCNDYEKILRNYKGEIDKVVRDLKPVNLRLAVLGFLVAIGGISPIMIILSNSFILHEFLSLQYYALFFFCYTLFFVGYIIIHRSVSCEWL